MGLPGIEIVGGVNGMDKRSDAAAGEMALTSEFWMNNYHQDLGIAAVKIEDATIDGDSREDASILFDSDILSTLPFQYVRAVLSTFPHGFFFSSTHLTHSAKDIRSQMHY